MRDEDKETRGERCVSCLTDKGHLFLVFTVVFVLTGALFFFLIKEQDVNNKTVWDYTGRYMLSVGLFAFAGGITNFIAIQMLFYKIPGIYGSGVIEKRYKSIRRSMKDMILSTFFQPDFLNKYIPQKLREAAAGADVESKINAFLTSEAGQAMLDEKIDQLGESPEGQLVDSMNINISSFKPFVKPVMISFLSDLGPTIMYNLIDPRKGGLNLVKLRDELDRYMCERMEEVTPQMMVDILYCVVLHYLGWLVVWGCIFGGIMGAACEALQMAPKYQYWG